MAGDHDAAPRAKDDSGSGPQTADGGECGPCFPDGGRADCGCGDPSGIDGAFRGVQADVPEGYVLIITWRHCEVF